MLNLNAQRLKKLEQNEGVDEGILDVSPEKITGRRTKHGTEEMDDETALKSRNHRRTSFQKHTSKAKDLNVSRISQTTDYQLSSPKRSDLDITEDETYEGHAAQRITCVNENFRSSTRALGRRLTKFLSPVVYWDLKGHISSHVSGTLVARSALLTTFTALLVLIFSCSFCCRYVRASEFPERECCDLVFPIPEPTGRSTSAPTPTGRSGSDIKTAVAILNCLFARQLCFEDPSCSAILEIIPRVCGPELVACSTVTVTKCQAALRTLQAFSFFRPTCLCKEPHIDPDCNSFRDFLFDHPCIYVLKKEKDPSQIEALPMCNHALTVCQRGNPCNQLYEDFKMNCKARDGKCRMENRDACHDSWTQLRLSPMFGCICPNNQINRRCDRIFSMVYHNPCVEYLPPSASVDLSGTDSALYPFDPQQESYQEIWLPPTSMYPYFLFPGTARTPYYEHESPVEARDELEHGLRRHGHRHQHGAGRHQEAPELPGRPGVLVVEAYDHRDETHRRTRLNELDDEDGRGVVPGSTGNKVEQGVERMDSRRRLWDHVDRVGLSYSSSSTTSSSLSSPSSSSTLSKHDRAYVTVHLQPQHPHQSEHDTETHLQHRHRHPAPAPPAQPAPAPPPPASSSSPPRLPRPTPTVDESERDDEAAGKAAAAVPPKKFAPRPTYEHRAIFDRADEDLDEREYRIAGPPVDRLFDLREALDGFVDQVKVISHPDNSTSFEVIESQLENPLIDADQLNLHSSKQLPIPGIYRHAEHHKKNSTAEDHEQVSAMEIPLQPVKLILSSTCHHAYTACRNDPECKPLLQLVLNHCDLSSCARNECMGALQQFYKQANHKHSVDIAFCLCKKTEDRKDECIVAQEKMHPVCAQRTEGSDLPTCHSLAESCKENKSCRMRLEYYEQSCAVDSVTKKCAGQPSECRKAMLGILGTELRSNCACKGTDLSQMHDCLGWQRLLWVNPCVVESQKDYHARRKHHHHPRMTTTSIATTTSTTTVTSKTVVVSTPPVTTIEQVEDNQIPEVTRPATESTETSEITTTSTTTTTTTPSTTTSTTIPPRFCVVQRPKQSTQYIREGKGKRLYREDEPECSELCHCGEDVLVTCNAICVETSPCKSEFAFYNHEAPAYQAHRGRCLCYSGRFICMRPSPDTYSIPHGVFMFLGYSEKDETLLRHYNNLTVLDAVSSLDSFIREEVNNQTVCTLFLYNVTRENVIAVARLGTDNPPLNSSQAQSLEHLMRVKDECASMLQDLSKKINEKHQEVHTHPLLSIFKMAEVEVKLPYSSGTGNVRTLVSSWLLLLSTLTSSLLARPTLTNFIGS